MKVFVTTLVSILVQFGLAILGWGVFAAFFSHPAFVAMTGGTVVASVVALFSRGLRSCSRTYQRTRSVMAFGRSTARLPAGSASRFSSWAASCGCGPCSCSDGASAASLHSAGS